MRFHVGVPKGAAALTRAVCMLNPSRRGEVAANQTEQTAVSIACRFAPCRETLP
jgi:hypothetical protein